VSLDRSFRWNYQVTVTPE